MKSELRQLVLDLPLRPAQGAEDFLVSGSNEAAVALIDRWPDWQHWAHVVVGPPGSGKSHLAHVWQRRAGAALELAAAISEHTVERLKTHRALIVEDVDRRIADERVLFHLLNLAREHKLAILLTSRAAPGEIEIALPDLRSRLRALPVVNIEPPDGPLLKGVLVKLFADRQIAIAPKVIEHLALHMERSMETATRVVEAADLLALAAKRRVSLAIAKAALDQVAGRSGQD